ncbi:MAG: MarC family protein [Paludibacteraceae bacterium]|nr:MarC family protein [Paludibacteraceae bacterium]
MTYIQSLFQSLDLMQIVSAMFFLIAIIDPFGNVPVTINMEKNGAKINPWVVSIASALILLAFLMLGEWLMKVFGIKVEYFAVAGGFIIFLMALEMILDITIFKADVEGNGNVVPLAFPMYAGPGAFTALIAMTAEYNVINLVFAVLLCIVILFFVLLGTHWLMRYLGKNTLYIIRKFFGIIVLAIACQLMFGNLAIIF